MAAADLDDGGVVDLTNGRTGTLLGCAILARAIPDDPLIDRAPLLALGSRTATRLWSLLEEAPQLGGRPLGVAHGWAGFLFAQLRWAQAAYRPPPRGLERRLAQLLAEARPAARGMALPRAVGMPVEGPLAASWCNGAAGLVPLLLLAHATYKDPALLEAAERVGRFAIAAPTELGSLCCGTTGVGFAALALLRATGRAEWRDAASRALARAERGHYPQSMEHSLYKGPLGASLLEVELEAPDDAEVPLFG